METCNASTKVDEEEEEEEELPRNLAKVFSLLFGRRGAGIGMGHFEAGQTKKLILLRRGGGGF